MILERALAEIAVVTILAFAAVAVVRPVPPQSAIESQNAPVELPTPPPPPPAVVESKEPPPPALQFAPVPVSQDVRPSVSVDELIRKADRITQKLEGLDIKVKVDERATQRRHR